MFPSIPQNVSVSTMESLRLKASMEFQESKSIRSLNSPVKRLSFQSTVRSVYEKNSISSYPQWNKYSGQEECKDYWAKSCLLFPPFSHRYCLVSHLGSSHSTLDPCVENHEQRWRSDTRFVSWTNAARWQLASTAWCENTRDGRFQWWFFCLTCLTNGWLIRSDFAYSSCLYSCTRGTIEKERSHYNNLGLCTGRMKHKFHRTTQDEKHWLPFFLSFFPYYLN